MISGCTEYMAGLVGRRGLEAALELSEMIPAEALDGKSALVLRSVLVALLNALSQPFMDEKHLRSAGYDVEAGGRRNPDQFVNAKDTVTMVGFGGQVPGIALKARKTYVTELEPGLFKSVVITSGGITAGPSNVQIVPARDAGPCFRESDTVFVTGCALVTDTLEEILAQCRGKRVIVYGSTACFFPEPLFKRGVSILTTRRITSPGLMFDLLANSAGAVERFFPAASQEILISTQT
ncbi:MAG: hypothetical protein K6T65_12225 [Peptococcaceae bacterium]|nr:hypothetical protein [Peptococcaceae bacterium]